MVDLDPGRCCYCGGCVGVCPVDALTLAETRLIVDECCIDCGDCVSACPVGALRPWGEASVVTATRRREYDVVVAGAGPAGSVAAETVARAGLSVLLLEKRQEIGSPVRCAEGVGADQLAAFIDPNPAWISARIERAEVEVGTGAAARSYRADGGRGYILERRIFDRAMAEAAVRAGAEVRVKTAVTGVLKDGNRVRGVRIRRGDFVDGAVLSGEIEISARIVIAADGVESQVGRWAGLDVQLPLGDVMSCAQYLLSGIDVDPTCTCYTIDPALAPGGYAWIFPKGEGRANVGLGAQADLRAKAAAGLYGPAPATVLDYLNRFVESNRRLAAGSPVSLIVGAVPVALPPARLVTDGLMLVGDAARQVNPLTGGGIINAMTAGRIAGQVAAGAIQQGDVSAGTLSQYEQLWQEDAGRKLQRNYRLRAKFPPEQRGDERFVQAFMLAAK